MIPFPEDTNCALESRNILPISNKNQTDGLTNENIVKLQEIAERQGVPYIDVYSVYVLNGEMNPEHTTNGVHLILFTATPLSCKPKLSPQTYPVSPD